MLAESDFLRRFGRLSKLEIGLVAIVFSIFFTVYMGFHYLPVYSVMISSADVLFIEDVARALNAGGDLFDWRLTQAPYIFPDIFVARLLLWFNLGVGTVAAYYSVIFGISLLVLLFVLLRKQAVPLVGVLCFAALLYSLSFYGRLSDDTISMYFGLIGHHSGVAIPVLLGMIASVGYFFSEKQYGNIALIGLFISIFLGIISDSSVAVGFAPFASIFAALLYLKKEASLKEAVTYFCVILWAVIAGKLFGYISPFPQDREFMAFVMSRLPAAAVTSLQMFGLDFFKYLTSSHVSALIALLFLFSYVIAVLHIVDVFRGRSATRSISTFVAMFILVSPVMAIGSQIALGLYGSIDSSRQWAAVLYLSIVFGVVLFSVKGPRYYHLFVAITALLALFLLLHVTKALMANQGKIAPQNQYSALIKCMEESKLPVGQHYISDYWFARPIRMYSGGAYDVSPYGSLMPFTNASNIKAARAATPDYIITGGALDYTQVVGRFGPAKAELCSMNVGGGSVKILDYSENAEAKAYLRNNAVHTY